MLLGTVVTVGALGGTGADKSGEPGSTAPVAPSGSGPTSTGAVDPGAATTSDVATSAPGHEWSPLVRTLREGVVGEDVESLQARLTELGFQPGGIDGYFGELTRQAVWAFEKVALGVPREQATGEVTAEMWEAMQSDDVAVKPRRPSPATGMHTEVYLPEQVLAVFDDGEPVFISHMSYGTATSFDDTPWCREVTISPGENGNERGTEPLKVGRCGVSWTPPGVYTYDRRFEGLRLERAGRVVEPGLLQLRDRDPRCCQRAQPTGLARLRADPERVVEGLLRPRLAG